MSQEAKASATDSQNAPNINDIPDFGVAYAASMQYIHDKLKEEPDGIWAIKINLEISATELTARMELKPPQRPAMKSALETVPVETDGVTLRVVRKF